jgi:D-amino peptidase
MKVLISTDIEGVAGVYHPAGAPGNPEYERARLLMTHEANAAIAGAFDAGATEVLVNDSHGDFRNMPPDVLDPRARVVQGKPRYLSMVAGVEEGVDAVCMVGYHSRAQGRGILAHTINSFAFAGIELNGQELGEAGLYGALAGEYGAPGGDGQRRRCVHRREPAAVSARDLRADQAATGFGSGVSLSPEQSRRRSAPACRSAGRARERQAVGVQRPAGRDAARPDARAGRPVLPVAEPSSASTASRCASPPPSVEAAVRMLNCCSAMSSMLR